MSDNTKLALAIVTVIGVNLGLHALLNRMVD